MESCPTQAVLPLVGLAAEKVIRDRYNPHSECGGRLRVGSWPDMEQLFVDGVKNVTPGGYSKLFELTTKQHEWLPQSIPLSSYAGQQVRLKFVADCGPRDNSTTDHAHWGAVRIIATDTDESNITKFQDFMTWVNDKPFRSGFYYQHVQSDEVDVAFRVEGSEPVVIHSVSAHAHPDAVCRTFEHGTVLANPSRKPYQFDLAQLSPGRQYRRFQGTANQDTQTNNGQPVGARVTLDERDGLFLKRVDAP